MPALNEMGHGCLPARETRITQSINHSGNLRGRIDVNVNVCYCGRGTGLQVLVQSKSFDFMQAWGKEVQVITSVRNELPWPIVELHPELPRRQIASQIHVNAIRSSFRD